MEEKILVVLVYLLSMVEFDVLLVVMYGILNVIIIVLGCIFLCEVVGLLE